MRTENEKLLLVSGCPRSGTTLINFLLNSHPEIAISNEVDLVHLAGGLRRVLFSKSEKFKKNTISRKRSDVESWGLSDFEEYIPADYSLLPKIIRLLCLSVKMGGHASIYGDKTPIYYMYDPDLLAQLSPGGTVSVIHITRNPSGVIRSVLRRTANSLKGSDYWRSVVTKSDGISHWIKAWNARSKFHRHSGIRFLDLNYDALLQDPDTACEIIAGFLEIADDFDRGLINSSSASGKPVAPIDFEGLEALNNLALKWEEMPLDLSHHLGELPLPRKSFWNKVRRKSIRTVIKIRRDMK